jgi:uncharacterized integral membrane protein (TIGR00698 family)
MISPQWSLLAGIILSLFIGQNVSIKQKAKAWSTRLLQVSIILLGSALNFSSVINQGATGIFITFLSILFVFLVGYFGVKSLGIEKKLGLLITMGTAICGGSAIGALGPVIAAESMAMTISMGIVFLLNASAVFLFPPLADFFQLGQEQFGVWAALAIHDTSSVVAASSLFGSKSLEVATTLKLTRALWIIPVTLVMGLIWKRSEKKFTFPWFILGFLSSSVAFTFLPGLEPLKQPFLLFSKNGFAITLFLIGLGFDFRKMKEIGLRPFIFGLFLWILVSCLSLIYVKNFL